jgi:hypothetical protein
MAGIWRLLYLSLGSARKNEPALASAAGGAGSAIPYFN